MKRLASGSLVLMLLAATAGAQSPAKKDSGASPAPPAAPKAAAAAPATPPARVPAPAPVPSASAAPRIHVSAGELVATPEMWFYEQSVRQYNDPKWMIRQKAAYQASERLRRLESQKWYGYSSARPVAGTDPIHGDYSPSWTSGNVYHPFQWSNGGIPTIVVAGGRSSQR
jgi:hypothetical protein